ncbi:MAG: hypothetical protein AB1508_14760 [Pseudomonadota bacterium]|jgi:hypothetical protein
MFRPLDIKKALGASFAEGHPRYGQLSAVTDRIHSVAAQYIAASPSQVQDKSRGCGKTSTANRLAPRRFLLHPERMFATVRPWVFHKPPQS